MKELRKSCIAFKNKYSPHEILDVNLGNLNKICANIVAGAYDSFKSVYVLSYENNIAVNVAVSPMTYGEIKRFLNEISVIDSCLLHLYLLHAVVAYRKKLVYNEDDSLFKQIIQELRKLFTHMGDIESSKSETTIYNTVIEKILDLFWTLINQKFLWLELLKLDDSYRLVVFRTMNATALLTMKYSHELHKKNMQTYTHLLLKIRGSNKILKRSFKFMSIEETTILCLSMLDSLASGVLRDNGKSFLNRYNIDNIANTIITLRSHINRVLKSRRTDQKRVLLRIFKIPSWRKSPNVFSSVQSMDSIFGLLSSIDDLISISDHMPQISKDIITSIYNTNVGTIFSNILLDQNVVLCYSDLEVSSSKLGAMYFLTLSLHESVEVVVKKLLKNDSNNMDPKWVSSLMEFISSVLNFSVNVAEVNAIYTMGSTLRNSRKDIYRSFFSIHSTYNKESKYYNILKNLFDNYNK